MPGVEFIELPVVCEPVVWGTSLFKKIEQAHVTLIQNTNLRTNDCTVGELNPFSMRLSVVTCKFAIQKWLLKLINSIGRSLIGCSCCEMYYRRTITLLHILHQCLNLFSQLITHRPHRHSYMITTQAQLI